MVFSLSALWWRRIRGLWKLPNGRDWLRGKLGLVLMDGTMLSKSLIQFSVDGRGCFLPCYLTWGQTMVEVMKTVVTSFKRSHDALLHSVPRTLQQASTNPRFHWRIQDTGKSGWVSCVVTAPFSCVLVHTSFRCALQESVSQSCVSSGSFIVRLMVASSKRAYATPGSAAPRAPVPVAVHRWPAPPQETLRHRSISVSVGSLGPGALMVCLSPLSTSGGNGVWFKMRIYPSYHLAGTSPLPLDMGYLLTAVPAPTILLGFLWPWAWRISSWLLQKNVATTPDIERGGSSGYKLNKSGVECVAWWLWLIMLYFICLRVAGRMDLQSSHHKKKEFFFCGRVWWQMLKKKKNGEYEEKQCLKSESGQRTQSYQ